MVEIFGTLGPSCNDVDVLVKMFEAGMTGMRLNMSHTSLQESQEMIARYREAARLAGKKAELLIDMQGPELRIGTISRPLTLNREGVIELRLQDEDLKNQAAIPIPPVVLAHIEQGDHILLDDGRMELIVMACHKEHAVARVIRGGLLSSHKSIKVVDKDIKAPALTRQDIENIKQIKNYHVTSLMQPFVRSGRELQDVKAQLRKYGADDIRLFAKIENRQGIKALYDIIPETDMLVIARGDLGNDLPLYELPRAQKYIEQECVKADKPFLVVTQMLYSMLHTAVPTRAEVSDIFNAVVDGASAVMVTNETAVGDYPVEVIYYLTETVKQAEMYVKSDKRFDI